MTALPTLPDIPDPDLASAGMETAELYRQMVASLATAVYVCDASGRVIFYNDAAAELWGRRPELGTERWCGAWKLFTPDGKPVPLETCPMAVALTEGVAVRDVEVVVERPDGTRRHVLPHPRPIRAEDGRVVGAVNVLVDVTEQREGQRAQALLAAIVASSDDAIISKSLEGCITSWNSGAQRIFGYTPEEIVGRPITTLIPKDRLDEETLILSRIRRGERVEHYETVRVAKDGHLLDISLTVSPVRDPSGQVIGASKVARDITTQKQAARDLARSETTLRTTLALLPVGVYSCDTQGRITFFNHRAVELWGRRPEDDDGARYCACHALRRPDGARIAPDESPTAAAARDGVSVRAFEALIECPDGVTFPASISADPIRDETGRITGALCVFQDISVEVAAREALRHQHRALEDAVARTRAELEESHRRLRLSERMAALGTLSAGLGHDMGNLLLPVQVSLESLAGADLPPRLHAEVERIRTSAQYLQQLANGLRMMALDPSRLEKAEPLDVAAWWADAYPIVKNALPRTVALEASVPPDLWIGITRPALTQVIFNLAQNAGEALRGQGGGRVRIAASREGGRVVLTVEDNGPGMTPDVRDRCMEPFFTTKARAISTGLGLVLVGGLVRDAEGTVQIDSAPGHGTAFRLSFPAAEPRSATDDAAVPHPCAAVDVRDARLRAVITAELRHLGFDVSADADDRNLALVVSDRSSPIPARHLAAKRVVLLSAPAAADAPPPHVQAIGERPPPGVLRAALKAAARDTRPGEGVYG